MPNLKAQPSLAALTCPFRGACQVHSSFHGMLHITQSIMLDSGHDRGRIATWQRVYRGSRWMVLRGVLQKEGWTHLQGRMRRGTCCSAKP